MIVLCSLKVSNSLPSRYLYQINLFGQKKLMIDRNQVKYESSVYSNKTKIQCVFRMNSDVDIIDAHFKFDSKELLSCLDDYTCTFVKIASHYQDYNYSQADHIKIQQCY